MENWMSQFNTWIHFNTVQINTIMYIIGGKQNSTVKYSTVQYST